MMIFMLFPLILLLILNVFIVFVDHVCILENTVNCVFCVSFGASRDILVCGMFLISSEDHHIKNGLKNLNSSGKADTIFLNSKDDLCSMTIKTTIIFSHRT